MAWVLRVRLRLFNCVHAMRCFVLLVVCVCDLLFLSCLRCMRSSAFNVLVMNAVFVIVLVVVVCGGVVFVCGFLRLLFLYAFWLLLLFVIVCSHWCVLSLVSFLLGVLSHAVVRCLLYCHYCLRFCFLLVRFILRLRCSWLACVYFLPMRVARCGS